MNRHRSVLLLAATLVVAACGGDSGTGPSNPTTGTLEIVNSSASALAEVYYSNCESPTWGANRMPNGIVITAGANRQFTVEPGCYDARVVTVNGLSAQFAALQVTAGQTRRITITNF